jgi:integrase
MLTDTAIKKAKPSDKPYKMVDEKGLHLLVRPNGSMLWQLRYRHEGKEKTASLGQYPDVPLKAAREKRDETRQTIAAGHDPIAFKRAQVEAKRAAEATTFKVVAQQWLTHWGTDKSPRHATYVQRRLEADIYPAIGKRPVSDIKPLEVVQMIKGIGTRGALDIAKRAHQTTAQIFRYAVAHGLAERNPATDVKPSDAVASRKKQNYARIDTRDLPALLRKIEAYQGTPTTRLAMKLMALTFVRTSELIGARWDEFDLEARRWDVPASRMKMKTPHVVPLSTQAIQVLEILREITGYRELLFSGERDHAKPMSNNTILAALDRMGYKGQMTGHGFRGLASTILHEQGYDHQHIELQLAHQQRNAVSAAYNHALYLEPRAKMMQDWGDYLEGLVRGNVIPLRKLVA